MWRAVGWIVAASTQALGQLVPVDQGVADRGPLSASHRTTPLDLRKPTNFDRVYEGVDQDGSRIFLRIDGAIVATFSASVYEASSWGMVPVIPAGTVFHIGEASLFEPRNTGTLVGRRLPGVDLRADKPPSPVDPPSLWTDEGYRQRRVMQRLSQAAEASAGR